MGNIQELSGVLDTLSPLKTLARGYSIVMDLDSKKSLSSIKETYSGQAITIQLLDGQVAANIINKQL